MLGTPILHRRGIRRNAGMPNAADIIPREHNPISGHESLGATALTNVSISRFELYLSTYIPSKNRNMLPLDINMKW